MGCVNLGCKGISIMLGSRIYRTYNRLQKDVELQGLVNYQAYHSSMVGGQVVETEQVGSSCGYDRGQEMQGNQGDTTGGYHFYHIT